MKAQSRHKNAPALDFARERGIILLKGNAVYSGQTLFFPTVCGRKEVLRMRKKAFELFICAVIVLYMFLINAH